MDETVDGDNNGRNGESDVPSAERGHASDNVAHPHYGESVVDGVASHAEHARHCFVVMPFGRDSGERKHFRGWYQVVIEPSIRDAGFEPVLAAAIDEPNAINDEIRSHLALDPMVVVDLGGAKPSDPPNPNVMYELGIRHALDLPLVLLAWEGQALPFDINNQRALIGDRGMVDIAPTRERLVRFIAAAKEGRFYRPMEAVRRIATVDFAADQLSDQSVLGAVAEELRELRHAVNAGATSTKGAEKERKKKAKDPALGRLLVDERKRPLKSRFFSAGGTSDGWAKLMNLRASQLPGDPSTWQEPAWDAFIRAFLAVDEEVAALTTKLHADFARAPEGDVDRPATPPGTRVGEGVTTSRRQRVHELAKELDMTPRELLARLQAAGVPVKAVASAVDRDIALSALRPV